MLNKDQKTQLEQALDTVSLREKTEAVVRYRFGLGEQSNVHTLRETAEQFGMTHTGALYHEDEFFKAADLDKSHYVSSRGN